MPVKSGESKQGLVVTLVFFILATIALGVSTYMGMSEQEKLKKAADAEKAKVKTANDERDYYMTVIGMLRVDLGDAAKPESPIGLALAAKKATFEGAGFPAYKDYPEAKALVAKLRAKTTEPGKPPVDIFILFNQKDARIKDLEGQVAKLTASVKTEMDLRTAAEAVQKADKKKFEVTVTTLKTQFEEEYAAINAKIDANQKRLKVLADDKGPLYDKLFKEKEDLQKEKLALLKKIKAYDEQVASLQSKTEAKFNEKPLELIPRGKIVRVHGNLRRATIDIGRSHNLKAGTTFAVYALAANGKPKVRSKGKIEVVSVGDRTADVVITHLYHPGDPGDPATGRRKEIDVLSRDNTDPIVKGDVLINPIWNPNAETHVAIAGVVDFTGTGAINIHSFIRLLEKQNIRVDAYVDPKDGTVKGPGLTRRTDFLILGSNPTGRESGVSRDDAILKLIIKESEALLKSAKNNAVTLINPRRFLQESGLNIPRSTRRD